MFYLNAGNFGLENEASDTPCSIAKIKTSFDSERTEVRRPAVRLPTWDELANVPEQLDVLEYPLDRSLFVVGPPGSGKTVLAVYRAQMAAAMKQDEPRPSVAIVTFNRMLRRLLDIVKESDISVQTMHSFVWQDYRRRTNGRPPNRPHDPFMYDWESMVSSLEEAEERPNRSHLVVDEGQDLPQGFFRYASGYVSRTLSVFADEDQAVSAQRTTLEQIKGAGGLGDPIILRQNHRNTSEIARLAEHFHSGRLPAAAVIRTDPGELPRLVRSTSLESTAELVSNWWTNRGGSIGIIVNENDTGRMVHGMLVERLPERRVDFYDSEEKNENMIEMLEPGVTILNKESVKGQEFDAVFILELEAFIPCTNDTERRSMYMMCTRARDNLFLLFGPGILQERAAVALPGADILERT